MLAKFVLRILFRTLMRSYVISLPKLELNTELRNQLIEQSKSLESNIARKYVRDSILEYAMRKIAFECKNDFEVAFNRGVAQGVKLQEERLQELATLTPNVKIEKDNGKAV